MKAAVYTRYGSPDVIQIVEAAKPVPKDHEVLIAVRAASVNPLDGGLVRGGGRFVMGLRQPNFPGIGVDVAGPVESVGRKVTQFKAGDEVFGVSLRDPHASALRVWICQGAFAEYACAPESTLARKPPNVTFEQAASVPVAALTALQGLRDKGRLQPGQRVLINGAAGGVGTFAVQIAKAFGAEVTAVCSTRNLDLARSLGADPVIDYTQQDFTQLGQRYDVLFDCVGNHSLSACRRILNPQGVCVLVGDKSGRGMLGILVRLLALLVLPLFASQRFCTFLARPRQADLATLRDLIKDGKVTPIIDKRYSLTEVTQAIRYLEEGHARGKVVITLTGSDA